MSQTKRSVQVAEKPHGEHLKKMMYMNWTLHNTTLHYTKKQHSIKKYNKYLVSQLCLSISPKLVHICLTVVAMLVVDFSELEIRSDEF